MKKPRKTVMAIHLAHPDPSREKPLCNNKHMYFLKPVITNNASEVTCGRCQRVLDSRHGDSRGSN